MLHELTIGYSSFSHVVMSEWCWLYVYMLMWFQIPFGHIQFNMPMCTLKTCKEIWRGHHHQRYIHTCISIYFANTTWFYYSHSCSSTYPLLSSGSSYLDDGDTCTLVLFRNNGVDQKGRGIAGWIRTAWQTRFVTAATTSSGLLLGVQVLSEKLIKSTFQWIWNHLHIWSESTAIVDLLQSPFQPTVLRHSILAQWAVYEVESNSDAS
jgi:hypothetical protein